MPSIQTSVAKPPSPTTWRKSPGLSRIHFKTSACRKRVETDAQASRELTAVQTDFLQYIFQAINNLLTQNLGFFDTMGQNLFRSFATILVAWFESSLRLPRPAADLRSSSIILQACF